MVLKTGFLKSRRLSLYSGAILAIAFATFAYTHWISFKISHEWMLLVFSFSEMLTAVLLLTRSAPKTVSVDQFDWIIGVAGTFAALLFRPSSWGLLPFAKYAVVGGVMIQMAGLISLNRSIAIVAAIREIKTHGLYRFVRHPLYASYVLTFSGYTLMNTSIQNVTIYFTTMALLFTRIFREERHLVLDVSYRQYMQKVPYRVIPYVF